jgi:hypothetical protein
MNAVEIVHRMVEVMDRHGVAYMAVGSFSSNVYGMVRSTKDADFVLELGDVVPSRLVAGMGSDFILDPQMSFETVTNTTRYRIFHKESVFMIELFLLSDDAHDQERFRRRRMGDVGGKKVYVPTAEDVVITKLRWSRQGMRSKDIDDVRGVLKVQKGALDLEYIRKWADVHGTRELLESTLASATRSE